MHRCARRRATLPLPAVMERLRTFGIVAHIDAGKTTLTERILHDAGAQAWLGSVDEGTAATDWLPQERSRGISITAAATRITWGDAVLQVVDTPGHIDFIAEVERCLHVLDGVLVVVDGVRGVESQTEGVWQQADVRRLPRLVFVNKLDRPGADFEAVLEQLRSAFDCVPIAVVVPLPGAEGELAGLGDACSGAVQWFAGRPDAGMQQSIARRLEAARDRLLEALADVDDEVLAAVVAGRTLSPRELRLAIRAAVQGGRVVPVLAGAALWNRGVDWLLDAVVALLPSPPQVARTGLWSVPQAGDVAAPFCGLVFKVQHVDVVWNYVRVVRGRFCAGRHYGRTRSDALVVVPEELWVMQADRHTVVAEALPGEIVVVPGEHGLRTGDTLFAAGAPVVLPTPRFPEPVLSVTFEADQSTDAPRLLQRLRELAIDDPTLRVDHDHGQVVVRGMGELHLDIVADLLRASLPFGIRESKARVDRRETVHGQAEGVAEVRAVVGGQPCSARCRLMVGPAGDSTGLSSVCVQGDVRLAALIDAALRSQLAHGVREGAMVGVEVVAQILAADQGSEGLIEEAATKAFLLAVERAELVTLEPWVTVDLWCPEECSAAVLADFGSRGVEVDQVSSGRLGARVRGRAPLASMLGYVTRLRSVTKGRGQASLRPAGYQPMRP